MSGVAVASFFAVFAGAGIALLGMAPNSTDLSGSEQYLLADIRTGVSIVAVGTFAMVACTVGVNQAAQILDRADISRSFCVMGAPLELQATKPLLRRVLAP